MQTATAPGTSERSTSRFTPDPTRIPADGSPAFVGKLRRRAFQRFEQIGLPTTRDEEWANTPISAIEKTAFEVGSPQVANLTSQRFVEAAFGDFDCHRIVFVNGHFSPEFSEVGTLPAGAVVRNLSTAYKAVPGYVEEHLGRHASFDEHAFVALNTAFFSDGGFIYLPPDTELDKPLHLIFASSSPNGPTVSYPRNLMIFGARSKATVVQTYVGLSDDTYLVCPVTEVVVGEEALIDHYKLQRDSDKAHHIATLQVRVARAANFGTRAFTVGGAIVRNDINLVLAGENIEATVNGFYNPASGQLHDNHTMIDHAAPNCGSREVYKGVMEGDGRGVFNGKIYVRPEAQKTDAKQTNRALLLSEDAQINTKPQLEIYADDVKCTHGAAIGALNDEHLFYLRARGVSLAEARSMLIHAFASEITSEIKIEQLRDRVDEVIFNKLMANAPAPISRK